MTNLDSSRRHRQTASFGRAASTMISSSSPTLLDLARLMALEHNGLFFFSVRPWHFMDSHFSISSFIANSAQLDGHDTGEPPGKTVMLW